MIDSHPKREILTYPLESSQIKAELSFFCVYFHDLEHESCEWCLGWPWASDYYESKGIRWDYDTIAFKDLTGKMDEIEREGFGAIGYGSLFIKIPSVHPEFHFCHDQDIHISFDEPGDITEFFYQRWKSLGYRPAEWLKNEKAGPGERLRIE